MFTGVMQLMGLERVVRVGGVDGAHIQPLAASPLATTAANPNLFMWLQYSVSPLVLTITQGSTVVSNEPMLEHWSA